jgi:LacI family transcriptional regulator
MLLRLASVGPLRSIMDNVGNGIRKDQGYQAAKLLDSIIQEGKPRRETIRVHSGPVIVRQSSNVLAVSDPDLAQALQYIADHFHESLFVEDVVRHSQTSRRKLYQLFERHLGRPIHAEILRRRLDHARLLLVTTTDKLYTIARACGFLDDQQLTRTFTREIGVSPSRYRQQQTNSENRKT